MEDDGTGIDTDAVRESMIRKGIMDKKSVEELSESEMIEQLGIPGLSTAKKVTEFSGRGVGFNSVRSKIRALGGSVTIESEKGKGTAVRLKLPLTTAVIQSLLVEVGDEKYALPFENIKQIIIPKREDMLFIENKEVLKYNEEILPLIRLNLLLDEPVIRNGLDYVVIVENQNRSFGLMVDSLITQHETIVKPFKGMLEKRKEFAGATILGDGSVALIIDVEGLSNI